MLTIGTLIQHETRQSTFQFPVVPIAGRESLLLFMNESYSHRRGIRVMGSAWSWNRVLQANADGVNVALTGLVDHVILDEQHNTAKVPSHMTLSEFQEFLFHRGSKLEWPPKSGCFSWQLSQTFGGFIANNVHNTMSPTAYEYVEYAEVAIYWNGTARIVTASREENSDLFESLFGGVGWTGIIVSAGLRLETQKYYEKHTYHILANTSHLHLLAAGVLLGRTTFHISPQMTKIRFENATEVPGLGLAVDDMLSIERQGLRTRDMKLADKVVSDLEAITDVRGLPGSHIYRIPIANPHNMKYWKHPARSEEVFSGVLAIDANIQFKFLQLAHEIISSSGLPRHFF